MLGEMARLFYRKWFVHFRFPGHEDVELVDSELGPIPDGWSAAALRNICEVNRTSVRKGQAIGVILYLDISAVGPRAMDAPEPVLFADAPGRARRVVESGDTIWSTVRPNRRSHMLVLDPPSNLICSTGFAVLSPTSVPPSYLFELSSEDSFTAHLESLATGAAYPAVRPPDFEGFRFAKPGSELINAFDGVVSPMHHLQETLRRQNETLKEARDLLLPRLVSGELDVSDLDLNRVSE